MNGVFDKKAQKYWDNQSVAGRTKLLHHWGMKHTSPTTKYKMLATSEKIKVNWIYYGETEGDSQ